MYLCTAKNLFQSRNSKWLKNHPGRVVSHLQIGCLLNESYGKVATVQNATNVFKETDIWPVNPDIFPDYMFEPTETTNIPLNQEEMGSIPELPNSHLPSTECINTSSIQEDPTNDVASILNPAATNDDEVDSPTSQNTTQATTNADI